MPRIKLTKSAIDALPTPKADLVYWDAGLPGFGVKITPKGRKVFIVLYRTGGAGSKLRKYRNFRHESLVPILLGTSHGPTLSSFALSVIEGDQLHIEAAPQPYANFGGW
jgi:hypothetical protein